MLSDLLAGYNVVLASQSPRRQELLAMICKEFEIRTNVPVDENYSENLSSEDVAPFLSELKFSAYLPGLQASEFLITSDTIVSLKGNVIGKPADLAEAADTLRMLSGNTHQVVTGVTVGTLEQKKTFSEVTDVVFDQLSDEEIDFYLQNFLPLDKAGAYGIQEWIGAVGVKRIEGSFYNVMGLPVHTLYREMVDFLTK